MAVIRAVGTIFLHPKHSGCFFYHTQAILQIVKKSRLISEYRNEVSIHFCFRTLLALRFFPLNRFV